MRTDRLRREISLLSSHSSFNRGFISKSEKEQTAREGRKIYKCISQRIVDIATQRLFTLLLHSRIPHHSCFKHLYTFL